MSIHALQPAFATSRRYRSPVKAAFGPATAPRATVLETPAEIEAIEASWRVLEGKTPEATGFQSFDWCRAWMRAEAGAGRGRWRVVCVWVGNELVALMPLQRERVWGVRVLGWMGEPWTQYGDALAPAGPQRVAHLAAAWREIDAWSDIDLVKLGRVRDDAALMALPGFTGRTAYHVETAPCLDLSRPFRPAAKGQLARRRRKLEAMGPVSFEVVADPAARRCLIGEAVALKRSWLRARRLPSSGLWHPNLDALLRGLASGRQLIVGRLAVGDETAALELGLSANGAFRSLLGCHDPRFAAGSPGHLLIGQMIEWCRAQGFATYDLMAPADPYKCGWSNDEATVTDHLVARTLRGRCAAFWFRARPALKTLHARMPEPCRRLVSTIHT